MASKGNAIFVVVEEVITFAPLVLDQECALVDEMMDRDGERVPRLIGGRDNEKFILAVKTSSGKWPEIPRNDQTVNMILAGCPGLPECI